MCREKDAQRGVEKGVEKGLEKGVEKGVEKENGSAKPINYASLNINIMFTAPYPALNKGFNNFRVFAHNNFRSSLDAI